MEELANTVGIRAFMVLVVIALVPIVAALVNELFNLKGEQ